MSMKKLHKIVKFLVFILCASVIFHTNLAQAGTTGLSGSFSDIQRHWAEQSIVSWTESGYIDGYANGKFMPNQAITRAEFCVFINRLMGYTRMNSLRFADIQGDEWYASELGKAVAAGYLSGYPDGTIRPNQGITRQEIASILTNILSLKNAQRDSLTRIKDRASISSWCEMAVNTVVYHKYMSGFPDKTFRPGSAVTRAEALAIFDRIVGTLYDKPGTYGLPYDNYSIKGNVFINCSNITLRNMVIDGDLYLTEGIGNGSVTLVNVKVKGTTKVSGGVIINNSDLKNVLVETANNYKLRLLAQGTTKLGDIDVRSAALLEEANLNGSGFNDVILNVPPEVEIEMEGIFDDVSVETPKAQLNFLYGTMNTLNLSLGAWDAEVQLNANTTVKKLSVVSRSSLKGRGIINNAEIFGDGVTIDRAPKKIKVAPGVKAMVNGRTVTGTKSTSSSDYYDRMVPDFVDNYPLIENIHSRGFDLLLKADNTCRAYYLILYSSDRVPSADEVIAGEDSNASRVPSNRHGNVNLSTNREKKISIDGLRAAEDYNVYLVLDNSGVDVQPPVLRVRVTTTDTKFGTINGKVSRTNGITLRDVKVTVKDGSRDIVSTTTKADGSYVINDLAPGTYTVVFSKSGYLRAETTKVTVSAGKTKEVNKRLSFE